MTGKLVNVDLIELLVENFIELDENAQNELASKAMIENYLTTIKKNLKCTDKEAKEKLIDIFNAVQPILKMDKAKCQQLIDFFHNETDINLADMELESNRPDIKIKFCNHKPKYKKGNK